MTDRSFNWIKSLDAYEFNVKYQDGIRWNSVENYTKEFNDKNIN